MKSKVYVFFLILFLASAAIVSSKVMHAQQQQPQTPNDPFADSFFPPEMVMQNQEAIGLTDEQKNQLKTELRQAQMKFTELQWQLEDQVEKMVALTKQDHPDEQQALAQLDKVLAAEREVKREQVSLMIRIKNSLTPEQ